MASRKVIQARPMPNVRKVVKSILDARVEHKRFANVFAVNSAVAGVVIPVTQGIVQGDDIFQRSGGQIILERMDWVISSVNILGVSNLRVILIEDRFNNGSVPLVTDLMTGVTPNDAYNTVTQLSGRFKIHSDFYLPTVNGTSKAIRCRELHHKLKDKIFYNAGTNVALANGRGALFLVFLDNGINCNFRVGINLTYTDA